MNHTLESYKVFPYIAWTLVIFFMIYTYALTLKLNETLTENVQEEITQNTRILE